YLSDLSKILQAETPEKLLTQEDLTRLQKSYPRAFAGLNSRVEDLAKQVSKFVKSANSNVAGDKIDSNRNEQQPLKSSSVKVAADPNKNLTLEDFERDLEILETTDQLKTETKTSQIVPRAVKTETQLSKPTRAQFTKMELDIVGEIDKVEE